MTVSAVKTGLYTMAFLAIAVSLYALSYYFISGQGFLLSKGPLATNPFWKTAFFVHAGSGAMALGTGWLQFFEKHRKRHINRHRVIGKIYAIAIIGFGSTSGMVLAYNASGGLAAKVGFGLLAFTWFYTTLQAWLQIAAGNIQQHGMWMIRSYALTLAAVTLRIWLPLALMNNINDAYPAISWFCWVPNLLVAEWFIIPRAIKKWQNSNGL